MVKALDLSSNGRVVRVGSNPTPGKTPLLTAVSLQVVFPCNERNVVFMTNIINIIAQYYQSV